MSGDKNIIPGLTKPNPDEEIPLNSTGQKNHGRLFKRELTSSSVEKYDIGERKLKDIDRQIFSEEKKEEFKNKLTPNEKAFLEKAIEFPNSKPEAIGGLCIPQIKRSEAYALIEKLRFVGLLEKQE